MEIVFSSITQTDLHGFFFQLWWAAKFVSILAHLEVLAFLWSRYIHGIKQPLGCRTRASNVTSFRVSAEFSTQRMFKRCRVSPCCVGPNLAPLVEEKCIPTKIARWWFQVSNIFFSPPMWLIFSNELKLPTRLRRMKSRFWLWVWGAGRRQALWHQEVFCGGCYCFSLLALWVFFFAIPVQGTIKRLSSLYMRSTIGVDFFQWKGLDEMHVGSDKVRPKARLQQVCAIIFTWGCCQNNLTNFRR